MFKKFFVIFFILISFVLGSGAVFFNAANADDDEREESREDNEEDDEEDEDENEQEVSQPSNDDSSSDEKTVTYKETVIVEPARTITENQTRIIYLSDKDRDGIADARDPHPEVAEIYVVKDDNSNGIVDALEYGT